MRAPMRSHKFRVGQNLRFAPRRMGSVEPSMFCKVVQQLPLEYGEPQYRIKCSNENVERVVKEYSLSRTDAEK